MLEAPATLLRMDLILVKYLLLHAMQATMACCLYDPCMWQWKEREFRGNSTERSLTTALTPAYELASGQSCLQCMGWPKPPVLIRRFGQPGGVESLTRHLRFIEEPVDWLCICMFAIHAPHMTQDIGCTGTGFPDQLIRNVTKWSHSPLSSRKQG